MPNLTEYRQLFDLSGKKALVVGAGSGIGEASAWALAAHGAEVICADVNADAVAAVAAAISEDGGNARATEVDITDSTMVNSVVDSAGEIKILVCTPSINVRKPLLETTEDEFVRVVDLNLRGTFNVMKATGQVMADAGAGSMIVFSSVRARSVEPGQGVYAATKAGAVALVQTMAAELGPVGVRVNAIGPGVVKTPLNVPIQSDPEWYQAYADIGALGRWSEPSEQTGAVVYLASDAASFVTGTILFVDGGWLAVDGRFTPPL